MDRAIRFWTWLVERKSGMRRYLRRDRYRGNGGGKGGLTHLCGTLRGEGRSEEIDREEKVAYFVYLFLGEIFECHGGMQMGRRAVWGASMSVTLGPGGP